MSNWSTFSLFFIILSVIGVKVLGEVAFVISESDVILKPLFIFSCEGLNYVDRLETLKPTKLNFFVSNILESSDSF